VASLSLHPTLDGDEFSVLRPSPYFRRKSVLDRRLDGPHSRSERCRIEKKLSHPGIECGRFAPDFSL
jgi:hypothetical protein